MHKKWSEIILRCYAFSFLLWIICFFWQIKDWKGNISAMEDEDHLKAFISDVRLESSIGVQLFSVFLQNLFMNLF